MQSVTRIIIFISVATAALALIHGYVGRRFIGPANLTGAYRALAWGFVAIALLLPLAAFFLRVFFAPAGLHATLSWIGFASLGFFFLLFSLTILRDLGLPALRGADYLVERARGTGFMPEPRLFLRVTNGIVFVAAATLATYGFHAARRPQTVQVAVPVKNLPTELEGFRIVQISDVHVGPTIGRDFMERLALQSNELKPDLVVITGDVADGTVAQLRRKVEPLSRLVSRHGTFLCTGNHEYFSGPLSWLAEYRRLGITVLVNEHRLIARGSARLLVAGIADHDAKSIFPAHASDPEAAFRGAPDADVKILLAHQPRSIFAAAKYDFDLQLSGHTHGGQMWPFHIFVRLQQPFLSGMNAFENRRVYVNRGAGYWGPPFRIFAPPELTLLTLTRAR